MMRSSLRTNLIEHPSNLNPISQKKCRVGVAASTAKTSEKAGLLRRNVKCARNNWGRLSKNSICLLAELTTSYSLSIAAGHLQLLDGRWYITHSGLLRLAFRVLGSREVPRIVREVKLRKWFEQRSASNARPTMSADPPVQPQSNSG